MQHRSCSVLKISTLGMSVIALAGLLSGCTRSVLSPERTLVEALAQFIEAKSWVATGEISVAELPIGTPVFTNTYEEVVADFQARYSRSRSNATSLALGIAARDDNNEEIAAEFRLLDEQLQFALTALPDLGELDLSALLGTAFFIPSAQAEQLVPALEETTALERAAMATVIRETPDLFTNVQELTEEKIEGATTRHFSAQLNIDAVNRILTQIAAVQGVKPQLLKPSQLDATPLELWVNKRSGALAKFKGELTDLSGQTGMVEIVFSNLNKRVKVEPLGDVRPLTFEELIKLLNTSGDASSSDANDQNNTAAQDPTQENQETTSQTDGSEDSQSGVPNTDTGNVTTEFVPEVPFPIQ